VHGLIPESATPSAANVALAVELVMGAALTGGPILARRKQFKGHAVCQTAVVLLNFAAIATFMAPPFRHGIVPEIPPHLGHSYYLLATAHGILGIVAEFFALHILLVAGTKLLPEPLRFTPYKMWMRVALALWWLDLLLGLATCLRW